MYDYFWWEIITIQSDLVRIRYIIWSESFTKFTFGAKSLQCKVIWCENVTIQSNLVWKRYNINSLGNNFVWLFLVRNRYYTNWFGAKTRHNLVLKRYKDSINFGVKTKQIWCENITKLGAKTRYFFIRTWCENVKTWCEGVPYDSKVLKSDLYFKNWQKHPIFVNFVHIWF